MLSNANCKILIAGAGISGLTCALALSASGFEQIEILESAPELLPIGAGINIQPHAVGVLQKLNLAEDLIQAGVLTHKIHHMSSNGQILWTEPRGLAAGAHHPQISIHRGCLETTLLKAVQNRIGNNIVRTSNKVHEFSVPADKVIVRTFDTNSGEQLSFEGNCLIGADGLYSAIRRQLHPNAMTLRYSGIVMWRGVAEIERFFDGSTMIISNSTDGTRFIAYPIAHPEAKDKLVPVNWVCMVPESHLSQIGSIDWQTTATADEFSHIYENWVVDRIPVSELIRNTKKILRYPMVDRDPLPFWGRDNVTLIGDAAHLMYPVGANGASQAIIDVDTLANKLLDHPPRVAFRKYEEVRLPATSSIIFANRERDLREREIAHGTRPDIAVLLKALAQEYELNVSTNRKENDNA